MREISSITLVQATRWMVMSFTELRNSVGRANFSWVLMRSGGIKGVMCSILDMLNLKHSSDYVK